MRPTRRGAARSSRGSRPNGTTRSRPYWRSLDKRRCSRATPRWRVPSATVFPISIRSTTSRSSSYGAIGRDRPVRPRRTTSSCRESTSPLMESRPGCGTAAEGARTQAVIPPAPSLNRVGRARCLAFRRTDPAFEPSLYQRQSPPSGNAIFQGRDKDPETAPAIQSADCRDKMCAPIAASSARFALNREIYVCAGLCGGPGRTRTSNQAVMSRRLRGRTQFSLAEEVSLLSLQNVYRNVFPLVSCAEFSRGSIRRA
jgi:hypothetical protein